MYPETNSLPKQQPCSLCCEVVDIAGFGGQLNKNSHFEQNLKALLGRNPQLYSRLLQAKTTMKRYCFSESRSKEIVPALCAGFGNANPLHSMVDPKKEGERLADSLKDEEGSPGGFVIFLGLGGAYAPQAALTNSNINHVIVIDFDINGIAELFCSKNYTKILEDPRFSLLVDPDPEEVKSFILQQYKPAICGGIRAIPLRARIRQDAHFFDAAKEAIKQAIEKVSGDYSVQAHFGIRWFSNIIRNLKAVQTQNTGLAPIKEAAICAAGPSLDTQIPLLKQEKHKKTFIISCDTALPALLQKDIEPDAVVSIDCQHISYYHFKGLASHKIPLFLDISSPPLLPRLSASPFFFCGGHPFALYLCQYWRPLPQIDTSGGNVTYASLSLAQNLGAQRITLYGCDFSYPGGRTYAKGTYLERYFAERQSRFAPLEAQHSSFLYRSPFLPREENKSYYETASLRFYRKGLEEKAHKMGAEIIAAKGLGAPLNLPKGKQCRFESEKIAPFKAGYAKTGYKEFLEQYRKDIAALPLPQAYGDGSYWQHLDGKNQLILATILPLTAAIKYRSKLETRNLIEEVKYRCLKELDTQL